MMWVGLVPSVEGLNTDKGWPCSELEGISPDWWPRTGTGFSLPPNLGLSRTALELDGRPRRRPSPACGLTCTSTVCEPPVL